MPNANGAVEVTISSDYTRLLQEASGELSSVVPPLSSNHGIVITLTGECCKVDMELTDYRSESILPVISEHQFPSAILVIQ